MPAETVTINSINLNVDGAWRVRDFTPLYGRGPARGRDLLLPSAAGETARARRRGAWTFSLEMLIFGSVDGQTSSPASDERATCGDNVDYLRDNLLAPYASGDATVGLVHTRTDSTTRSGDVVGVDLLLAPHDGAPGRVMRASLVLVVPAGQFTA